MAKIFENGIISTSASGDSFISSDIIINGSVHWVDSVNGNDSNAGTEEAPLATLAQAHTNATADNGDVVILKSGHTETVTSSISLSKAGLAIYGLGSTSSAPNFTCNATIDMMDISGSDISITNLYFPASTAAAISRVNLASGSGGSSINSCTFLCGANDLETITVASGSDLVVYNSTFTVSADGPDAGIEIEAAVRGFTVDTCTFDGGSYGFDAGGINSGQAHLNYRYNAITLTNYADITHTASAKGLCSGTVAGDGCHVNI